MGERREGAESHEETHRRKELSTLSRRYMSPAPPGDLSCQFPYKNFLQLTPSELFFGGSPKTVSKGPSALLTKDPPSTDGLFQGVAIDKIVYIPFLFFGDYRNFTTESPSIMKACNLPRSHTYFCYSYSSPRRVVQERIEIIAVMYLLFAGFIILSRMSYAMLSSLGCFFGVP